MTHTKQHIASLSPTERRKLFWSLIDGMPRPFSHSTRNSKNQLVLMFSGYKPDQAYTCEELFLLPFGIRFVDMSFDKISGLTFCYSAMPVFGDEL